MAPTVQRFDDGAEEELRRYEYEDTVTYAADVGGEATADVVEGTVMVVAEGGQTDFEIRESGPAEATVNNGVLTVEVER